MALTYFITPSKLKELSFINDNVEDSILKPVIQRVQRRYIEKILGSSLYRKMVTEIQSGTVSSPYDVLLEDYIEPVLIAWCEYKAAPHVNNEIRNKSVGKSGDSDISPSTEPELNYLVRHFKEDAQSFEDKLIGHLCDNSASYPEYNERTGDAEDETPQKRKYVKTSFIVN